MSFEQTPNSIHTMKTKLSLLVAGLFLAAASSALATVRYVNFNNTNPTPPYTNWATAATDIQSAVDAAGAGDEIVVTNGTYAPVSVDTPLTLQSVNGPDFTVINGGGTNRCLYLTNEAVMVGFTLTNGWADYGGGAYCESNAVLTNCVLTGNSTYAGGDGGGAYGGTLNNCTLTANTANLDNEYYSSSGGSGGGACNCTLNNCTLTGNSATAHLGDPDGGGACYSTLNNCTLTGNSASWYSGGADGCTLNNCTVTGNSGSGAGDSMLNNCVVSGNTGDGADGCTLNNCTLTGNSGDGAEFSTLNNCTVTGNSANDGYGGGAYACSLNNCIVYFNSDSNGGNYDPSSTLNYCCTTPMPTNGVGNISADPQLASASYLSPYSPCIGAGSATYTSGTDIDGEPWANPPSIGCEEYHPGAVTGPLTVSLTASYTNVAEGFPVGLTAFIAGRTDLSVWDFGDGDVAVNEPYTSHTWTARGDYLVALWAYNDSHPEGVSATVTVHVDEGVHYVAATSGNPVAPYLSWATAATNIQDAVNVAGAGGTILVTNGTYATGGELGAYGNFDLVVVDKPLTLQSVNGPDFTVIDGLGTNQCVYLTDNAMMVGFTLTNGISGVYCEANAVLTNCVLTGNSGGGACFGTLNNCTVTGNSGCGAIDSTLNNCVVSGNAGGGANGCMLNNCTLTGNSATGGGGGGAYESTLNNCTLTSNSARYGGGAWESTLNNCTLTGNSAPNGYGGGVYGGWLNNCTLSGNSAAYGGGGDWGSTLNNCTLTSNSAINGYGGGAYGGGLNDCTLTGNSAYYGGGDCSGWLNNCTLTGNSAYYGGGAYDGTLNNCIVYFNTATNGANYYQDHYGGVLLTNCCTTPMPGGIGNITNAPLFVDYAGGNLRLQSNSPCINAGNNAYVVGTTDLDGNPRIVGATVDIGAYEYQTPVSMISYAWLQQYGLSINTNTDTADLDGTGMNVYQDWIAGLNPTNALSVLQMTSATPTHNPAGLVVTWQSVSGIMYFLQSSTNLEAQPAFTTIQSNIIGQAGTTSYTDTNAVGFGPYFYRVGVGN